MASRSSRNIYAETLAVFDRGDDPFEPRTATEVADALGANRRTVYKRLQNLADRGELETKSAGARARVWWRPAREPPGDPLEPDDQLRALVRAVDEYAVFTLDPDGRVASWNDGAERIAGYASDEIAGEPVSTFYTDATAADGIPEQHLQHAAAEGAIEDEGWRVREDGSRFPATVTVTAVRGEAGDLRGYTTVVRDLTDRSDHERRIERQRDALRRELDEVYRRIDDAVYALDEEWRFIHVNERAERLLGRTEEELLGTVAWEAFPEAVKTDIYRQYREAMETQESVRFEVYYPPSDRWYEVRAYPSEEGLSVHFLDVTTRKKRERDLEESERRYRTLVDNLPNGAVTLVDEELRYVTVGGTPMEEADTTVEQLEGNHVREVLPPDIADSVVPHYVSAFDGEPSRFDGQFGEHHYQFTIVPVRDESGDVFAAMGMSQDITERKRRERELERYETIVETVTDGIVVVDADSRFRAVNDAFADMTEYPRERLVGAPASLIRPDDLEDRMVEVQASLEAGTANEVVETMIQPADAEPFPSVTHFARITLDDGTAGRVGVVRDISVQVERERRLERQIHQLEVIAALGEQALETRDLDLVMAAAAELVADTLDNDYCKVLDLDVESDELLLRQGVGWRDGIVGSATVSAVENDSQAAFTLATGHPVVVEDLATEPRFSGPELLTSHDVRSGISTIVGSYTDPWGVLGTHDTAEKAFSEDDVNFVGAVANILATAINRHEHERALARQREQLAAQDDLNRVVREITDAVIEQSTREEIEQVVCDQLAASDSYAIAWTADIDRRTERISPRAGAGADDVSEPIGHGAGLADLFGLGPVREAFRTGEMTVARDVLDDPELEHWRDVAVRYGFRSFAAIPIVYGGVLYGVIGVHSERTDGFGDEERRVVDQLGEVVGHAISGVEQKQALMSDSVTEVELKIRRVFETFGVPVSAEGTVTINRAVPIGDERYLVYGTATGGAMDAVTALVDAESVPRWESVTVLRADDDATHFELKLAESLVLSTIGAHGGYIEETVFEGGDCYIKFHLSSGTDVQGVIERIKQTFPHVEMVMRRQRTRADRYPERTMQVLSEGLTDRQQAALEAAYFAGFFHYPRDCSGEDVASALDISSSTFHQHVRKAQKTLLDVVFADA